MCLPSLLPLSPTHNSFRLNGTRANGTKPNLWAEYKSFNLQLLLEGSSLELFFSPSDVISCKHASSWYQVPKD